MNLKKIRIRKQAKEYEDAIWNIHEIEGIFYDGSLDDWLNFNYHPYRFPVFFKSANGNHYFGDERYAGLTEIDLSQSDNDLSNTVFCSFRELESFVFPPKIEIINKYTFCWCTSLKRIVFPDNLKRIESSAFHQCQSLENIRLPKSLEFIDKDAFTDCDNLKTVYFEGTLAEWKKINNKSKEIKKCKIICSEE